MPGKSGHGDKDFRGLQCAKKKKASLGKKFRVKMTCGILIHVLYGSEKISILCCVAILLSIVSFFFCIIVLNLQFTLKRGVLKLNIVKRGILLFFLFIKCKYFKLSLSLLIFATNTNELVCLFTAKDTDEFFSSVS